MDQMGIWITLGIDFSFRYLKRRRSKYYPVGISKPISRDQVGDCSLWYDRHGGNELSLLRRKMVQSTAKNAMRII